MKRTFVFCNPNDYDTKVVLGLPCGIAEISY